MGNLLVQAAILGIAQQLTTTEVLAALTCRAALALKKTDRGILKENFKADFIAFKTADFQEILYRQGQVQPEIVWKNGLRIEHE
jgi:imidazolonepropionase